MALQSNVISGFQADPGFKFTPVGFTWVAV